MVIANFIIPLLLLILGSSFIIWVTLDNLCHFKTRKARIRFYIVLCILISLSVYFKTIWNVFIIYSCCLIGIFYILRKILEKLKLEKGVDGLDKIYYKGITVFVVSGIIVGFGVCNANNPVVKTYDIKIDKEISNSLKIAVASDIHLGTLNLNSEMNDLINLVNEGDYDTFIILGDFYDEFTKKKNVYKAIDMLSDIKTKYGIYYVEGNHDLLTSEIREYLKEKNINVLEDTSVLINDEIYLVGRKDYRRTKSKMYDDRESLDDLLKFVDKSKAVIVLDHQPETKELMNGTVDLQISGHTHAGQIVPKGIFLKYGYYENDFYRLIVSAGFGVWNSSVRIGSECELISVLVHA